MGYNRRTLLRRFTVGAASATVALDRSQTVAARSAPAASAVAPAAQKFRVGYQLLSWSRFYPAGWWRGCRELREIGFRGVEGESVISSIYEGRADEFKSRMKQHGMELAALYSTSDLERTKEVWQNFNHNLEAAEFLAACGGRTLVIGGSGSPKATPEDIQRLADTANKLGRMVLEKTGVRVAFHPHAGSLIQYRDEIGRLMELTDPRYFFLAPDTGHLGLAGCDPVEVFRAYAKRIAHTHFKDHDPNRPGFGGGRGRTVSLGKGTIDFPALVEILKETGYEAWVDVETDSNEEPRATAEYHRKYVTEKLGLTL